ncbi:MAG: HPr(Ser) kinase/phosphatase [Erysipelotrichaceae bacterium]|nr:HPr(Ser) kinase/phosphatase [Erysipelotrichaceae bacterium]
MRRKTYVRDVYNYFGYRQISGDDSSLSRCIADADVIRPGLELTGHFDYSPGRIVVLGTKELRYIEAHMPAELQKKAFDFLTRDEIPMILISKDQVCPQILLDIAREKNFPIFTSYAHTNSLIVELLNYLEDLFADIESIHGVLMQVYGRGVLITGESGIGKSEIALELVKKGHILVADDRVDVFRAHNRIFGEAPELLRNMLELRGVDVINVVDMFGVMAATDRSSIECVVELKRWTQDNDFDRLGLNNSDTMTIFGIDLPKMVIPVREGRSIAAIIEATVTNIILRQKGINSSEVFDRKVIDLIKKNEEEK